MTFAVCGLCEICFWSITFGAFQALCMPMIGSMLSIFHEKRSSSVEAVSGITFVRVFDTETVEAASGILTQRNCM